MTEYLNLSLRVLVLLLSAAPSLAQTVAVDGVPVNAAGEPQYPRSRSVQSIRRRTSLARR